MRKPLILMPTARSESQAIPSLYTNRAYSSVIEKIGGTPLLIARPEGETLGELITLADGLLLLGGTDVEPSFYNEENINCFQVDPVRDQLEISLLKQAMTRGLPILGICRGMQVINVALGGSLYQNIASDLPLSIQHDWHLINDKMAPRNRLSHEVTLADGSRLQKIVGSQTIAVNSLHHQGIKRLGAELKACAHSSDGLVEAIEHQSHSFLMGVQWHPEELLDDSSLNIFESFIQAATNRS